MHNLQIDGGQMPVYVGRNLVVLLPGHTAHKGKLLIKGTHGLYIQRLILCGKGHPFHHTLKPLLQALIGAPGLISVLQSLNNLLPGFLQKTLRNFL